MIAEASLVLKRRKRCLAVRLALFGVASLILFDGLRHIRAPEDECSALLNKIWSRMQLISAFCRKGARWFGAFPNWSLITR
jgi:hypothetical protein